MNMKYYTTLLAHILLLSLMTISFTACESEEYMAPPEGEQVPYEDTETARLNEVLSRSEARLFYQAWQRSNMDDILDSIGRDGTQFTALALSDAAMQQAGYSQAQIEAASAEELDVLLLYYTLRNRITQQDLAGKKDDLVALSIGEDAGYQTSNFISSAHRDPYYYRFSIQLQGNSFFVNGKKVGTGQSIAARDGYVWLLDDPVKKPTLPFLQAIEADGRFTMLLEIMRYNDDLTEQLYIEKSGWGSPRDSNGQRFSQRFGWEAEVADYVNGRPVYMISKFSTLFLPTDDAFRAAGFQSLDDLTNFDIERGYPDWYDPYGSGWYWALDGYFATDSLLDYHVNWGRMLTANVISYNLTGGTPMIYSNTMDDAVLSTMTIPYLGTIPEGFSAPVNYFMPLEFGKDGTGRVTVKVRGSDAEPATIIDADIPTLMGPIHAVDRLLVPAGFKLDN